MLSVVRRLTVLVLVVFVLGRIDVSTHDLWIEPSTYGPAAGAIVGLRLRVGVDFVGDPVPRDPSLVKQFVFEDESGRRPVVGRDGSDPAGYMRLPAAGVVVAGYHSHPSTVEQTAEKFNQYLKEEGLDQIVALRASRRHTNAGAREIFSRCAKTLVQAGAAGHGRGDRVLGFTLELVAEQNPYTASPNQDLPIRLVYEGRPLPGTLVVAVNRSDPAEKIATRTDKDGRVRLPLRQRGVWLVKAVHMIPAPAGANADWASYWASLTFER